MSPIASRQNAKFKTWLSLLEAKGIKKSGLALVSGRKLVNEVQRLHPAICQNLIGGPKDSGKDLISLSAPLFKELDVLGTHAPLLVTQVEKIPAWEGEAPQGLELIVALSDPGNLGAVLRSAEAFGVSRVILTKEASSPFLPKAIRASSGAVFRLKMAQAGSVTELNLKDAYALDMQGENIIAFRWPRDLHLILGEEGRGIPKTIQLKTLSIPMQGSSESLNATTAASIALFTYKNFWS